MTHLIYLIHRNHLTHLANLTHLIYLTQDRSKSAQDRPGPKIDTRGHRGALRCTHEGPRLGSRSDRGPKRAPSVLEGASKRHEDARIRGFQIDHTSCWSPRSAQVWLKRAPNWSQTGPRTGSPVGGLGSWVLSWVLKLARGTQGRRTQHASEVFQECVTCEYT